MVRSEIELKNMSLRDKILFLNRLRGDKEEEIKDLEKRKQEEAELIEAEIFKVLNEMSLEEQKEFLEREEKRNKSSSLEQTLENVETSGSQNESVFDVYAAADTSTPANFYDLTNYNIYSKVKDLAQKAEAGNISPSERNFLSGVAYNINRIKREEPYDSLKRNDTSNYLSRTSTLLEKLDKDLNRFRL